MHIVTRLHIGRLLVESLRILLRPAVSLFGGLEHIVGVGLVDIPVDHARLRHHGREVKRGRHVLDNRIARGIVLFGHHATAKLERRHLVVDTAILVLHGEHPVQVIAYFFQDFGILRKFARDIPAQGIQVLREIFVGFEQRKHGNARVHDILAVVTRIVPAACRLDRLAGTLASGHLVGTVNDNLVVLMASGTGPLACIFRRKRHARTLVIEPLEGSLYQIVVDVLADHNRGTHVFAATEQTVSPRNL